MISFWEGIVNRYVAKFLSIANRLKPNCGICGLVVHIHVVTLPQQQSSSSPIGHDQTLYVNVVSESIVKDDCRFYHTCNIHDEIFYIRSQDVTI